MATQASTYLTAAQSYHRAGEFVLAESLYLKLLDQNPGSVEALHHLGLLHADTGRSETAVQLLRAAIAFEGPKAYLCRNLGIIFERAGDRSAAMACYRQAVADSPGDEEVWKILARWSTESGDYAEAANCWRNICARREPGDADWTAACMELGHSLARSGQRGQALTVYAAVLARSPNHVEAQYHWSVIQMQMDQTAEAADGFVRTLQLDPGHSRAANNLAILHQIEKRFDEAIATYRNAVRSPGDFPSALYNLATAWHESGRPRQAISVFRKYLKLEGGNAAAWTNLGNSWLACNEIERANECYRETLRLTPGEPAAQWNLGIAALLAGDLQQGWRGYERRFDVKGATARRPFTAPLWRGEPIEGKTLLLHAEQGLGDTIQFIRYAPRFAAEGARVIVECQAALLPLLRTMPGVVEWIPAPAHGSAGPAPVDHLPTVDFQLPLLSAPAVAATDLGGIPMPGGYLKAPSMAKRRWSEWLGAPAGRRKIGVVWAGNPNHKNDRNRSIPPAMLGTLENIPGVEWINLQKGHPMPASLSMRNAAALLGDFADTAGLVANLDAVVSVDTSVAHLAGAMGVPVWILLPYSPDWRWMLDRADSPWYRSARLFRQRELGNWTSVLREVAMALRA